MQNNADNIVQEQVASVKEIFINRGEASQAQQEKLCCIAVDAYLT